MKTQSIFWSKNFEIYKYHYETYGETGFIEEGETRAQARYRIKVNCYNDLHEDFPHLKDIYPLPVAPLSPAAQYFKEIAKPISHGEVIRNKVAAEKVITRLKGQALIDSIKTCNSPVKLKSYEKDLDSDEAEKAYNDKWKELLSPAEVPLNS